MSEILQKIVDYFSNLFLGIKKDDVGEIVNEKNVKYTITSVFPSKLVMTEAEKYL